MTSYRWRQSRLTIVGLYIVYNKGNVYTHNLYGQLNFQRVGFDSVALPHRQYHSESPSPGHLRYEPAAGSILLSPHWADSSSDYSDRRNAYITTATQARFELASCCNVSNCDRINMPQDATSSNRPRIACRSVSNPTRIAIVIDIRLIRCFKSAFSPPQPYLDPQLHSGTTLHPAQR